MAGARIPSVLINSELNESVYTLLPMIDSKTLLVAVSFPDYYFMTQKVAEYAKKKKARVLAISDSREAEVVLYADAVLTAPSTTRLALNTLSVPMALANMLTSAVKIAGGQKTRKGKHLTDLM